MITFHSRQSDCARHVRKNENAGTVNFTTQIAPSICTAMNTKRVKTDATIFKSLCSRTVVCYRLDRVQALPLIFIRLSRLANCSLKIQRSPARRSRNVREPSHKKSGEMSRSLPHDFPAIAGQWQTQCRRIPARATRETTRNMVRNNQAASASQSALQTTQRPVKLLAGRLTGIFFVTFSTMTPKNYEHIIINTQS
jgi:hypothetical protein